MENLLNNTNNNNTNNGTALRPGHPGDPDDDLAEALTCKAGLLLTFGLIDILTFLIGQPVIARLLWFLIASKKTSDLLNLHVALFYNTQYLLALLHLCFLFLYKQRHLKLVRFLLVFVQTGGPMTLTFISLERYFAVVHPTLYPLLSAYRFRPCCVACVWVLSLSMAFLHVLLSESISGDAEADLKTFSMAVMLAMVVVMFLCSIRISRELRRSGPGRDTLHPAKRRALRTVRATAFTTIGCYIPVAIMQRKSYDNEEVYSCVIAPLCIAFLSAASIVHPLLYLSKGGKLALCSRKTPNA